MDSVGAELGRTELDSDLCPMSSGQAELPLWPTPVYLLFTEVVLGDSSCPCGVMVEAKAAWRALVRARANKLIRRPRLVEIAEGVKEITREAQISCGH